MIDVTNGTWAIVSERVGDADLDGGLTDVDVGLATLKGSGVVPDGAHVLSSALEAQSLLQRVGAGALAESRAGSAQESASKGRHGWQHPTTERKKEKRK